MTTPATGFDFEALRRWTEGRDADALVDLYAEDAEMLTVNKNTPPSRPLVMRGKEEISEFLREVCAREMTHRIENEIIGEGRVAFNEECHYPDGVQVFSAVTMEVDGGKISRQVNVEAWDE